MRALPSFIILGKRYKFSINRNRPLIRQFLESGFILLAEEERSELVVGGIGQFWKLRGGSFPVIANTQEFLSFNNPNYAKATINFLVHQNHADEYVKVSTETRFYVPDHVALKKLARYWLLIHPYSFPAFQVTNAFLCVETDTNIANNLSLHAEREIPSCVN